MPTVAVIIPAWRAAAWITGALDTIAAQTVPVAEVVVVEDAVADDLSERVGAWRPPAGRALPVQLLRRPVNAGVSTARNAGVAATAAQWVAFLDADDRWAPDHLERALVAGAAGADVVVGGIQTTDEHGTPLADAPRALDLPGDQRALAEALFTCRTVLTTSTVALTKAWFERVGGFDAELTHGEDADLWLRLAQAGARWAATGQVTCLYRKHSGSAMAQTARVLTGTARFQAKHLANPILPAGLARRALRRTLWATWRIHRRGDPAAARAALAQLQQIEPWQPFWRVLGVV